MHYGNSTRAMLASAVLFLAAPAFGDVWEVDPAHSAAQFKIAHMMISKVKGTITGIKGTFTTDAKDITKLKVETSLDPATVSTQDVKRDEHLKSADFFDVAKHPTMTFKSTKVVKKSGDKFDVMGELTIHGVTKPVTLASEGLNKEITDPYGNKKVGFSATTKINRKDFGLVWNKTIDKGGLAVGDTVDIEVELELQAQKETAKGEKKS